MTALSTSVLNDTPYDTRSWQGESRNREPTADDAPAVVKHVHRLRPTTPSSELTPLRALWERHGRPEHVELALLCDAGDSLHQTLVAILQRYISEHRLLAARLTVEATDVDVAAKPTGAAQPVLDDLPRRVLHVLVDPDVDVVVNGSAGVSMAKQVVVALAGVAGVPVFFVPSQFSDDVAEMRFPPVAFDRAEALRRLDAAALARLLPDGLSLATELGVGDLVERDGQGLAFSPLAEFYEQRALAVRPITPYPACAHLLRHQAQTLDGPAAAQAGELANTLERLVDHWVAQRLWSLNLVPEMVAHDDRHVERVDHLLAALVAPLVRDRKLAPEELFIVSCAAWLHDWGHVGEDLGAGFVSHPVDVRKLHGLLSAQLIRNARRMHDITDTAQAAQVAVLCAHHQGWTSFGSEPPREREATLATRLGGAARTLTDDARDAGLALDRAQLLVALLRVADAADVGAHRIPDFASREDFRSHCLRRTIDQAVATLPPDTPLVETLRRLRNVAQIEEVRDAVQGTRDHAEQVLEYLDFVKAQDEHYTLHRNVLSVRIDHCDEGVVAAVRGEAAQVDQAIRAELDRSTVRQVLAEAGLTYGGVRSA